MTPWTDWAGSVGLQIGVGVLNIVDEYSVQDVAQQAVTPAALPTQRGGMRANVSGGNYRFVRGPLKLDHQMGSSIVPVSIARLECNVLIRTGKLTVVLACHEIYAMHPRAIWLAAPLLHPLDRLYSGLHVHVFIRYVHCSCVELRTDLQALLSVAESVLREIPLISTRLPPRLTCDLICLQVQVLCMKARLNKPTAV